MARGRTRPHEAALAIHGSCPDRGQAPPSLDPRLSNQILLRDPQPPPAQDHGKTRVDPPTPRTMPRSQEEDQSTGPIDFHIRKNHRSHQIELPALKPLSNLKYQESPIG